MVPEWVILLVPELGQRLAVLDSPMELQWGRERAYQSDSGSVVMSVCGQTIKCSFKLK